MEHSALSGQPAVGGGPCSSVLSRRRAVNERADEVWRYLYRHHRGAANAVTQENLAAVLGLGVRVLQQVLQHLTNDRDLPIVASCRKPKGVYVPVTAQEKAAYAAQLHNRIKLLAKRLSRITRIPLERILHQERLFAIEESPGVPQAPLDLPEIRDRGVHPHSAFSAQHSALGDAQ